MIIPAHGRPELLAGCLAALAASDYRYFSVLAVDDASDPPIATAIPDVEVLRLDGGPRGPAYARNRGAEHCRAPVLVFVDADVRVHAGTLSAFARRFSREPELGAVFGSYDATPSAPGTVSQFRNLLHHFHHQRGAGEAETFWAGCGAVRADAFRAVGGFDEARFPQPSIEDVELGFRLRSAGHRIVLDGDIQCTHDKQWKFREMVRVDVCARGVPWTQLLLERPGAPRTLNLSQSQRLSVVLIGLAMAGVFAAPRSAWGGLGALFALAVLTWINAPFYRLLRRVRGPLFAIRAVPLHWVYFACCGAAAAWGLALHGARRWTRRARFTGPRRAD